MSAIGRGHSGHARERGQILVLFVLGLVAMVAGVALVIDAGIAYAQQRGTQNGSDSAANAGAVVLAQMLGGATKTDTDVAAAVTYSAGVNAIDPVAYYTNVYGEPIDGTGAVVGPSLAARVGNGTIPPNAQGVHVSGTRAFDTTFARVIGLNQFTAGAEATAVTGKLIGGAFLPVIFPVNITDCAQNGSLGLPKDQWPISEPGAPGEHPIGTEYIVPLCKTGGGSFQVLDLDGTKNNCDDEVTNPPPIQWDTFPVEVASDNGNNCAKKMVDAVNDRHGEIVLVPICDNNDCNTTGGSHATYHVTGVVAFWIDYMSDSNNKNNSLCQTHTNSDGQLLQTIAGNGSSSCIAGWFIHFITTGPVGSGSIGNGDAIGVQLIK
ncbi:MAG TPA: pilus assembly protein TadG-related protein [Candidatus Binatia bacterium]|nr:pilus assembly protein TadG-related protein [Candidatus Binatia bacterium]